MRERLGAALAVHLILVTWTSWTLADPATGGHPAGPASQGVIAAAETPGSAASRPAADLGPSAEPPWNPPRAMPSRRAWERVLLAPGYIASIPLYGLGMAFDKTLLYVEDRAVVQRTVNVARALPRAGISIGPSSLGDRTGLGAKISTRAPFFGGAFRNLSSVVHSASLRHYHLTEVKLLGTPLGIEYHYGWRPQDQFFGIGMESSEDSVSTLSSQDDRLRFSLSNSWNHDDPTGVPRTYAGMWIGPRTQVTGRGKESGVPSIEDRFPTLAGSTFDRRFEHLVYGARLTSDWRTGTPHWAEGWRALIELERFDRPIRVLAMRSARAAGAQFTRTTVELETGTSFMRDPRTFRIKGKIIDQGITSGGDRFMVQDLSSLGGREGLHGFEPGRFNDVDLMLVRVAYVFPLVRRFEMEVHGETGGVFPDLWEDASIGQLEQSFGFAFRARMDERPIGAIGMDFSRESIRVRYTLGRVD